MKDIITIDGFSGCMKTTLGRRIAKVMNIPYISAGTLYRLFAFVHSQYGNSIDNCSKRLINGTSFDKNGKIEFEGNPVEMYNLNTQFISQSASILANNPNVVNVINEILKGFANNSCLVIDGRNLGEYVFNNAIIKVFVESDIDTRMEKWVQFHKRNGIPYTDQEYYDVKTSMEKRDYKDLHREYQPLTCPKNAIRINVLNTSVSAATKEVIDTYSTSLRNRFKLEQLSITKNKVRIEFDVPDEMKKYFNENWLSFEFSYDISNIPADVALSPFILLLAPIIWCLGMVWIVDYIDKDLYYSLKCIKRHFEKSYHTKLSGKIIALQESENCSSKKKRALFYSGGVDATFSLNRLAHTCNNLIVMKGFDFPLTNSIVWEAFRNRPQTLTNQHYIDIVSSPNLHNINFTNIHNDFAVNNSELSWWTAFEVGLFTMSHAIIPAFINGYESVYLSTSYSSRIEPFFGAATSIIDNMKLSWCKFLNCGEDYSRLNKIKAIINNPIPTFLRVCWKSDGQNCCNCEKCARTILGLYILGKSPKDFGFDINDNYFILLKENIKSFTFSTEEDWIEMKEYVMNSPLLRTDENLNWIRDIDFHSINISNHLKKINRKLNW